MKFAVAFAAIVAVAVAGQYQKPFDSSLAELEAIVAAIQSPSTDPATAALLEQQLADLVGVHVPAPAPAPVVNPAPIAILPAFIDFPLPDGGAVTAEPSPAAVVPSPAAVAPAAVDPTVESSPLVQIIINVNSASSGAVEGAPALVTAPVVAADPVQVVDQAVNTPSVVPSPVIVVDKPVNPPTVVASPVIVVDKPVNPPTVVPSPVIVVDKPSVAVAAPEPVVIAPAPAPVVIAPAPAPVVIAPAPEPVVIAPAPVVIAPAPEPIEIGAPIFTQPIVLLPDILN